MKPQQRRSVDTSERSASGLSERVGASVEVLRASCQSAWGWGPTRLRKVLTALFIVACAAHAHADSIQGRWKLIAAEDLRADGTVARLPWGRHPVGAIVVDGGSCYVQIMSGDVPTFTAPANGAASVNDQMKSSLLSSYIAYSGPCTIDEAAGSLVLKVEAAWRPDYVGTEQKRFFRFDNGKLIFGPAPNSMRGSGESLTRRLTLERAQP